LSSVIKKNSAHVHMGSTATRRPPEDFASMSRDELLKFCRKLYDDQGVAAFTFSGLKSISTLYFNLYNKELPQKTLLKELGIAQEYKQYILSTPKKYGSKILQRWSWDVILEQARTIIESEGYLPPALWFQKNGHQSLVQAIYNLGHTWAELREAVGDFSNSNFVQSRNGIRWLSHAEASLSNFLYARGIEHKKGERYDESFADLASGRYAIFDLHFLGKNGKWFDVEIWGDRPNGHNEEKYAKTRSAKEHFNSSNPYFLGIHFADCYDEAKLTEILKPHIGVIAPFQFDKPTDALIYSTHWSNADELLDFCKELASKMPNGEFPAEDWLRKRGRWTNRDGEAYNTLAGYIRLWLGGIRNLRKLIGQAEVSTQQWNRESALSAYKEFYDRHGLTPQQVRHKFHQKTDMSITNEDSLQAVRIAAAVQKYADGADAANKAFGINSQRQTKWSKDVLLAKLKQIVDEYGLSPNQLLHDHRKGMIELPAEKLKLINQIIDAVTRFPGGLPGVYNELGIKAPKRKAAL
jgi:hypothetical protein